VLLVFFLLLFFSVTTLQLIAGNKDALSFKTTRKDDKIHRTTELTKMMSQFRRGGKRTVPMLMLLAQVVRL